MEMTITLSQYAGGKNGAGYRAIKATDMNGNTFMHDLAGKGVVEFIEEAIQEGINRAIRSDTESEAFTVILPSITLGAEIQAHLVTKYTADPVVSGLTFQGAEESPVQG